MKRRLTLLTLTTLAAVALIGVVSRAPSPALAEGATQISGVAVLDEADECDSGSVGADFALIMDGDGDLDGCLYTFVETAESSPSGTYRETGTELFVASDGVSMFETTYRVEAKFEDVDNLAGTIFERCQHPIVEGSGTGIFEGVSGHLFIRADVEAGNYLYKGHLQY